MLCCNCICSFSWDMPWIHSLENKEIMLLSHLKRNASKLLWNAKSTSIFLRKVQISSKSRRHKLPVSTITFSSKSSTCSAEKTIVLLRVRSSWIHYPLALTIKSGTTGAKGEDENPSDLSYLGVAVRRFFQGMVPYLKE